MPETLLSNVSSIVESHQLAANENGELFNIFNILRARRSEVNTHSRFIFELLNPKGSHGEKDVFTCLFVKTLFPDLIATALPEKFTVQREDLTDEGRRVDFTIRSAGNYLIGIEMKIDAADQTSQLYDYFVELNRRKTVSEEIKLAYLTLYGKKADKISLLKKKSNDGLGEGDYHRISFKVGIIYWLDQCVKNTKRSELKAAIVQYKRLIESLTGVSSTLTDSVSKAITTDSTTFNSALNIEKALIAAKAGLQLKFWEELEKQLIASGKEPEWFSPSGGGKSSKESNKLVKNYYNESNNSKPLGIRFLVDTKIMNSIKHDFYFTVYLHHAVHYGISVMSGRAGEYLEIDSDKKKDWRKLYEIQPKSDHRYREAPKALRMTNEAKGCLLSFYSTSGGSAINFWDFKAPDIEIFFDAALLEKEVQNIVNHQEDMVSFVKDCIIES